MMYPINRLLKCRVEELGLTKKEIAEKMGYKNLSKGISKVHDLVYRDYYSPDLLRQFLEVVPVDEFVLELALEATESMFALKKKIETARNHYEESDEQHFIERTLDPYMLRRTEKRLNGWAFQDPKKRWYHPVIGVEARILELSRSEMFDAIRENIKADLAKTGGSVSDGGKIIGYYFIRDFKNAYYFDTEGNLIRNKIKLRNGNITEWRWNG